MVVFLSLNSVSYIYIEFLIVELPLRQGLILYMFLFFYFLFLFILISVADSCFSLREFVAFVSWCRKSIKWRIL